MLGNSQAVPRATLEQETINGGYLAPTVWGAAGGLLLGAAGWLWTATTIEVTHTRALANLGLLLLALVIISTFVVVGLAAGTGIAIAALDSAARGPPPR